MSTNSWLPENVENNGTSPPPLTPPNLTEKITDLTTAPRLKQKVTPPDLMGNSPPPNIVENPDRMEKVTLFDGERCSATISCNKIS